MKGLMILGQYVRLGLRELALYLELLMLPGGAVLALTSFVSSHWPRDTVRS